MSDIAGRHTITCNNCFGKGKIIQNGIAITCPECNGKGYIADDE